MSSFRLDSCKSTSGKSWDVGSGRTERCCFKLQHYGRPNVLICYKNRICDCIAATCWCCWMEIQLVTSVWQIEFALWGRLGQKHTLRKYAKADVNSWSTYCKCTILMNVFNVWYSASINPQHVRAARFTFQYQKCFILSISQKIHKWLWTCFKIFN